VNHYERANTVFPEGSFLGALLTRLSLFGWVGVDIFLTPSSFLIVTLLTLDRQRTGTVAIKSFYVRRILRIWPLYYGSVLFSMFCLPPLISQPYGHPLAWHLS
jgi:peptidoglycan/LPS O-acetylase OafA/YrhL